MLIRPMIVVLVLAIFPYSHCFAQAQHADETRQASTILDSYTRAKGIIDSAVAAHGGIAALRVVRRLRVTMDGYDYHRNQSRRLAPPYDSTPRNIVMMIDLARGQLVNQQTSGYPGGFVYTNRFVTDSTRHHYVDVRNHVYTNEQYPPAAQQHGNLFQVPHGYLLAAYESASPGLRRYLGRMRLGSGTIVDAVLVSIPNTQITLGFDPASHQLRAVMSVAPDVFTGDTQVETEFFGYRQLGGVLLPDRVVLRRGGEVIRELRYTSATPDYAIPDSLRAPPPRFTLNTPTPPVDPVRELAAGVWAIRGGGSWSMLVAFSDHLLALDASPNGAPEVIARAKTLAPGKPIRFVVPTHHHDDHFGGVRHYAAAGATTVTTPGNVDYFRRIVSAPPSTLMPNQAPPTPSARLETIAGKRRVFSDGTRTVEIHDIGPSPHADEMLVAWLPAEGILFQGDLIEAPASGVARRGANAETTTHLADFIRRQGWQVRVFGGVHAFLAEPQEFEELVRQPIIPAR